MEIRILGPVSVLTDEGPLTLGGPKPRTLLARLAVSSGAVVSVEQLIDAVWGADALKRSRASVHTYVSTLRKVIVQGGGQDVIMRGPGGYRLAPDVVSIDLDGFVLSVRDGRRALREHRFAAAAKSLGEGLDQWHGTALDGADGDWASAERDRLSEMRLAAVEDWSAARLFLDDGPDVLEKLAVLVREHPLRERMRAQLMTALFLAGRQDDALRCFQQGRQALAEELGVEPGPEMRQVHAQILRGEISLPSGPTLSRRIIPHQLPPDIADFTGRETEMRQIKDFCMANSEQNVMRLTVLSGKPGAGKTTLATHAAHQFLAHFDGGQLYANLRGAQTAPVDPADILARFLRALGTPDLAMPADIEGRTALYRTLIADRRVLVVLDDAADEQQVRPLLPGGSGCAVLVTSRNRMSTLEGAAYVHVGVLAEQEALAMLGRLIGRRRLAAQQAPALDIVRLCGALPLAVRIAGARLAARSGWSLDDLARRLRNQHRILHELTAGDLEVRGSLVLSYTGLDDSGRRALRRMGWLRTDVPEWLVAALLGSPGPETAKVLERLLDVQLLDGAEHDRYRLHDLVRAFAMERATEEETAGDLLEVARQVAERSLQLAEYAVARLPGGGSTSRVAPADIDTAAIEEQPTAWLRRELPALIDVIEWCSRLGEVALSARLTTALTPAFAMQNWFDEWWHTHSVVVSASRRSGDREHEAHLLAGLGWLRSEQDRYSESADFYRAALTIYSALGDRVGQGKVLLELSLVLRDQAFLAEARAHLDTAVPLLEEAADRRGLARAEHTRGAILTELGELPAALQACGRAVRAYRELDDQRAVALALRTSSIAHRAAGNLREAAAQAEEALASLRVEDDPTMVAYAVQSLAKVRIRQGLGATVRDSLHDCLADRQMMRDGFGEALLLRTLGELELAEGDAVRAKTLLTRALDSWRTLAVPLWEARTLRDLAMALRALGDTAEAERVAGQALEIFACYGSRESRELQIHAGT